MSDFTVDRVQLDGGATSFDQLVTPSKGSSAPWGMNLADSDFGRVPWISTKTHEVYAEHRQPSARASPPGSPTSPRAWPPSPGWSRRARRPARILVRIAELLLELWSTWDTFKKAKLWGSKADFLAKLAIQIPVLKAADAVGDADDADDAQDTADANRPPGQ